MHVHETHGLTLAETQNLRISFFLRFPLTPTHILLMIISLHSSLENISTVEFTNVKLYHGLNGPTSLKEKDRKTFKPTSRSNILILFLNRRAFILQ